MSAGDGLLLIGAAWLAACGVARIVRDAIQAANYRKLLELAARGPQAAASGSVWTITYKEGRATKTFKVPGAKSESDALAALMAARIRYDAIVSVKEE